MMQRAGLFMLVLGLTLFGSPSAFAQDDGQAPCPMSGQSYGQGDQSDNPGMGRHGGKGKMGGMHGKGPGPHREMHGRGGGGMRADCPKMGGMKGKGKGGMCAGCPKMGGMKHGMGGRGGMGHGGPGKGMGGGLMGPLHRWFFGLMEARPQLGLTDDQMMKLDDAMTSHQKFAIRQQADIRTTKIDLKAVLRRKPLDLAKAQQLIQQMATQEGELQSEGIQLYDTVWNMLSEQQRASVTSRLGSPFPGPWDGGWKGYLGSDAMEEAGDDESSGGEEYEEGGEGEGRSET
jgi:Spy/CpxP family protein refolding chaperone